MRCFIVFGTVFLATAACGGTTTGSGLGENATGGDANGSGAATSSGGSAGGSTSTGGTSVGSGGGSSGSGGAPGAGGSGGATGSAGDLKWYATCGPPICREPSGSGGTASGQPPCTTTEKAGDMCTSTGTECDSGDACSGPLVCATSDPKHGGSCPISRAKYKTDIEYLSAPERAKLADDIQSIPLVRYRYKDGPEREHLGFIIEDVEPSPGVDSQHDQVDLYGYTSMAVAALQEQHREIEALKQEVRELREELRHAKQP